MAYLEPTLQLLKVRQHISRSTPGPGPSRSGFGFQISDLLPGIATMKLQLEVEVATMKLHNEVAQ